jgi:ketosteroid isomerase-like protein
LVPVAATGNLEIARHALETWSRGDVEAALATVHPDVEWHLSFDLPDVPPGKNVFRGREEVGELWRAFRAVWQEITLEIERVVFDEGPMLVVQGHFSGRGAGSGAAVDRRLFYVMEIRNRLLVRMRSFDSEEEALAAAGARP